MAFALESHSLHISCEITSATFLCHQEEEQQYDPICTMSPDTTLETGKTVFRSHLIFSYSEDIWRGTILENLSQDDDDEASQDDTNLYHNDYEEESQDDTNLYHYDEEEESQDDTNLYHNDYEEETQDDTNLYHNDEEVESQDDTNLYHYDEEEESQDDTNLYHDDEEEESQDDTIPTLETVEMASAFGRSLEDIWSEISFENFLHHDEQPQDDTIYTMYHGTGVKAAFKIIKKGFKRSAYDSMLGEGVYVSRDIEKAERYPLGDKRDQVILKLNVKVGRVIRIDDQGHPLKRTWHDYGYDTAWVPQHCGMVGSGLEEDCVWDPKRIELVRVEKAPPGFKTILNTLIKWSKK